MRTAVTATEIWAFCPCWIGAAQLCSFLEEEEDDDHFVGAHYANVRCVLRFVIRKRGVI